VSFNPACADGGARDRFSWRR